MWSTSDFDNVNDIELERKQNYANFKETQIQIGEYILYLKLIQQFLQFSGYWTHVKEIPSMKVLVSLNQIPRELANMIIFDISQKVEKKAYTFEEVPRGKIDSTWMDNNHQSSLFDKAIYCTHHSTLFVFLPSSA